MSAASVPRRLSALQVMAFRCLRNRGKSTNAEGKAGSSIRIALDRCKCGGRAEAESEYQRAE